MKNEHLLEGSDWLSEEKKKRYRNKRLTRGRAIRLKCLDCMCGNAAEVRRCPSIDCPLYNFRLFSEKKSREGYPNT